MLKKWILHIKEHIILQAPFIYTQYAQGEKTGGTHIGDIEF
ncbi:hypothetical protein MBGDF03_00986 [Thermoplasmatales archaeon SCGC AB-540-F20]|nr:hypothetical protein MBGDF03_00986 [Thermoplasmatales archaeon SCGC AB-540-F20]